MSKVAATMIPAMDCTDRTRRLSRRQLSRRVLIYIEMLTTDAL